MDMFYQDEAPYLEDEGKTLEKSGVDTRVEWSVNEYFYNLTFQHYYLDYVIKWPLPPSLPPSPYDGILLTFTSHPER